MLTPSLGSDGVRVVVTSRLSRIRTETETLPKSVRAVLSRKTADSLQPRENVSAPAQPSGTPDQPRPWLEKSEPAVICQRFETTACGRLPFQSAQAFVISRFGPLARPNESAKSSLPPGPASAPAAPAASETARAKITARVRTSSAYASPSMGVLLAGGLVL